MDTFKKIFRYIPKITRRFFWLSLCLGVITSLLSVGVNVAYGSLADRFVSLSTNSNSTPIIIVLGVILALYLLNAFVSFFQERASDNFRVEALNSLRKIGYEHLENLPVTYYENNRPGAIVQKTTYIAQAIGWLADFTDNKIYIVALPTLSLVVMFYYHPLIGAVTIVGIVGIILMQMRKTTVRKPYLDQATSAWEEAVGIFTEHVSHTPTARTTVHQAGLKSVFFESINNQKSLRLKQNKVEWRYNAVQLVLESLTIVAVLSITAWLAIHHSVTIGVLVAVTALLRQIMFNTRGVAFLYDSYINALREGSRFLELLDEPVDTIGKDATLQATEISQLEFRDVSFAYSKGNEVLSNISFILNKGKKIALVGPSGGGKSSITKLVQRLYAPTSGSILINGQPLEIHTFSSTRQLIGSVMQDVALFHLSIKENILLARPNAHDKDITSALKTANAWAFVSKLDGGPSALVGERGVKLSGGQKQRIAIARAAVKKPDLIVLDEATSALDSESEKEVQAGLTKLMKGKMAIIVAHRLSTITDCDEIIVIDKGTITERGTHAELILNKGAYAELWAHQSGGFITEN